MSPNYYPYLSFLIPKVWQQKELWWVNLGWTPAAHQSLSITALLSRKRGDKIRGETLAGQNEGNFFETKGKVACMQGKEKKRKNPNQQNSQGCDYLLTISKWCLASSTWHLPLGNRASAWVLVALENMPCKQQMPSASSAFTSELMPSLWLVLVSCPGYFASQGFAHPILLVGVERWRERWCCAGAAQQ